MHQIKWLWNNLKGCRALYIFTLFLSVLINVMHLTIPVFSQQIVDIFLGEDAVKNIEEQRSLLLWLVAAMVISIILRSAIAYGTHTSYEYTSQQMIISIRKKLFRSILNQDIAFYDKYRTGDVMTRMTGDMDAIRHMAAWIIRMVVECLSIFIIAMCYFVYIDPLIAVSLVVFGPIIFAITLRFRKKIKPMHVELREKMANMNTAAQENISGNRVVKAFAREDYEIESFDKQNREFKEYNTNTALLALKYTPFMDMLANSLPVVLLITGGLSLIAGRISMGEYVAFAGMTWTISNPMKQLGTIVNQYQRFQVAAKKVMEIEETVPKICDKPDAIALSKPLAGAISFEHVSFAYEEQEILHDVSFTISAGQTVAIMGETGSGKTTLINMIPRFYDVTEGSISIDGVDVRAYKLKELRKNIGLAAQDVLLFSDTIDGNIAYGDSKMPEEIVHNFAKSAAASEFIEKMPLQYETIIGERGVGISGGQKQRISLARALAIRPSILILHDTTSAVDLETESYIQKSLRELDFPCTKIIIAQRISSTKDADKIIILENGKITEMGTHKELLEKKGYYYQVYLLQNGGEE